MMRPPVETSAGLPAVLRGVVADMQHASGADIVSIFLYEESTHTYYAPFATGQPQESLLDSLADMTEQLGRYLADSAQGKAPEELGVRLLVQGNPAIRIARRVNTKLLHSRGHVVKAFGAQEEAVAAGAKMLIGGQRRGALFPPTVLADVPRDCRMVVCESFGPLAPILTVRDLDDALVLANSTAYGLSSGVVTTDLNRALKAIKMLRCGTVNINEVPGFRVENSPFGGIKDSGVGIKEGVIEAMKGYSFVKTFSLPW